MISVKQIFKKLVHISQLNFVNKEQNSILLGLQKQQPNDFPLPAFQIELADQIKTLYSPSEFYSTILTQIKKSRNRIHLSSLYIGTGDLEQQMLKHIRERLIAQITLKCTFMVDYNRCLRGNNKVISSFSMLKRLKMSLPNNKYQSYQSRLAINLFKVDNEMMQKVPLFAKWHMFNELLGVYHIKYYIFDDNVIISGANLSHSYFSDRRDRYILLQNCPHFINFLLDIQGSLIRSQYCYQLNGNGDLTKCNTDSNKMQSETFKQIYQKYEEKKQSNPISKKAAAIIVSTIQIPFLRLDQDEKVLAQMLTLILPNPNLILYWFSGYMNFPFYLVEQICSQIRGGDIKLICAAPQANSFYNAGRLKGMGPKFYRQIEHQLLKVIQKSKKELSMNVHEFRNQIQTFHSKGIWHYDNKGALPNFTVIGSSNYSHRSFNRDMEQQFCIFSECEAVQKQFHKEITEQLGENQRNVHHVTLSILSDLNIQDNVELNSFLKFTLLNFIKKFL